MPDILETYFPELPADKIQRLSLLESSFRDWNTRINLVSRKDMDDFVLHHLVHSLAITKWIAFPERSRVLDVGTGGGLPGSPLAICFPQTQFFLCDSIAKKARAIESMVSEVGLKNVFVVNKRAEKLESKWNFILGRAVTSLPKFLVWIRGNLRRGDTAGLANGVFYWKGSLYEEELAGVGIRPHAVYPIHERIPHPYFEGKFIVHLTTQQVLDAKLPEDDS